MNPMRSVASLSSRTKTACNRRNGGRLLGVTLCLTAVRFALAAEGAVVGSDGAYLLKFPYPYQAAATVGNHVDGGTVDKFEAVHTLINTTERIERSSTTWKLLFADPAIDQRPAWRDGVQGFGLPIGDSIFLCDRLFTNMSLFVRPAQRGGAPVLNTCGGKDFAYYFDRWRANGWLDSLHTPGVGSTREVTELGLKWLESRPQGRIKVWIDHLASLNATGLGPDPRLPALPYVFKEVLPNAAKNIVRCGLIVLRRLGIESVGRRIVLDFSLAGLPPDQTVTCWALIALMLCSIVWIALCLVIGRLRRPLCVGAGGAGLLLSLVILHFTTLVFSHGADPKSPYYCADLARKFGFRYYGIYATVAGQPTRTPNSYMVTEADYRGRLSPLHILKLWDGSSCLVFHRGYKDNERVGWAYSTLEMLTEDHLTTLCDRQGWCLLYTNWLHDPTQVFTAKALDGLAALRRFRLAGRVWVAPTSEILDYAFIRTFLEYTASKEADRRVIDILRVNDPIGKPYVPRVEELRGISFECPADLPVEVRLAGKAVDKDRFEVLSNSERRIVRFSLKQSPSP